MAVHLSGPVDPERGWVIDFADIDTVMAPILDTLDHHHLNRIKGLENPTCENIARWIWDRAVPLLPGLSQIRVSETPDSGAVFSGRNTGRP